MNIPNRIIPKVSTGFFIKEFHNIRQLSPESMKIALKSSLAYSDKSDQELGSKNEG